MNPAGSMSQATQLGVFTSETSQREAAASVPVYAVSKGRAPRNKSPTRQLTFNEGLNAIDAAL